jgi:lambda family phage tail tape measure protein
MLNAKENASLMSTVSDGLANILKGVISVGLQGVVIFQRLAAEIGAFVGALKNGSWLSIGESLSKANEAMEVEGKKTVEIFKNVDAQTKALFADPSQSWDAQIFGIKMMQAEVKGYAATWTQAAAPILAAGEAARNALLMFLDSSAKRSAGVTAEAQTVGLATDAQARLRVELEAQAIATAKGIDITDAYRRKITEAAEAAAVAAQRLAGANLTQASLMPWQQRNAELVKYNALLAAGAISSETFAIASNKIQFPAFSTAALAATDFAMQVDQLATNSLNNLASSLASVITGAKSAAEAFREFATRVITQLIEMIIKALLFRLIMAAIGFSGGGAVGGETGLSLTTTGGLYDEGGYTGAGGKYQPAGVVHKGEVVFSQKDVAAWGGVGNVEALRRNHRMPSFDAGGYVGARLAGLPAASAAPAPAAPAMATVEMRGAFFDRGTLGELIDGLNGMFRNGYRLKLAGA